MPQPDSAPVLADRWLTTAMASDYTRSLGQYQSQFKIRRAAKSGALKAKKTRPGIKTHWIVRRSDVDAWLEAGALTYGGQET